MSTDMPDTAKAVVVIGAGIVGVSAARYLQRSGHRVTLVDHAEPGLGASFGNAGCFNPSSLVPIAGPDTFRQVPRYLMDPLGPLSLPMRYLPRIAPWLLRYGLAGSPTRIRHQATALKALLGNSLEALAPLLVDAQAEHLVRRDGILIVYRSAEGVAADSRGWDLRREHGIVWEELDRDQLRAFDPNLTPNAKFGKHVPGNGHTVDPEGLVRAIADSVVRSGGRILKAKATGFSFSGDRLYSVQTDGGPVQADAAVVAAGAYSRNLALAAGDRVPLETERGYHAVIRNAAVAPRVPTTDSDNKFVVTPMTSGVRVAGTVELAGLSAPPNWRRSQILMMRIGELFPALGRSYPPSDITQWMGHRPSLPDSLPVIGRSRRSGDVIYAFGHGHVGMTAGPFTGVIVADLVSGHAPPIDLAPFRADRF